MVKKENMDFSLPDSSHPGFPPQPLKTCTSAAAASAGISRNQNPTYNANGPIRQVRGLNQRPPHKKRSRPAARPRRSGWPQKSKLISELGNSTREILKSQDMTRALEHLQSYTLFCTFYPLFKIKLESITRNTNRVSPIQSTRPQERTSSFISSLEIAKDQSSLQANDQVAEHGSQIYSSPHSLVGLKTYIRKKTGSTNFYERVWSFGRNNLQTSEGTDPKILQHVANALHYMAGSQTAVDDAKIISRSANFKKSPVHTLKAINKKHGDITRDCSLESDSMKALVLLGICKVVQDLQKKQLKDLDTDSLDSYYTAVRDAEKMKVNVQWLRSRLDEIKDACSLCDEAKDLIDERDARVGNIDGKKKELSLRRVDLERLKSEVGDIEEQLAREVVMVAELNKKYVSQMSKISWFQHANLMDGII